MWYWNGVLMETPRNVANFVGGNLINVQEGAAFAQAEGNGNAIANNNGQIVNSNNNKVVIGNFITQIQEIKNEPPHQISKNY